MLVHCTGPFRLAIKKETSLALFKHLQQSKDYRHFLKTYLTGRSLSLSDYARATGFGRSFPSDVLSGKRRLTARSAYAFEKALRLPLLGKKFFRLLVAKEELDTFPETSRENIENNVKELRTKSWQSAHRKVKENDSANLVELLVDSRAMAVYAASGEPDSGATREDIEKRTRLFGKELERNIENLERAQLIELREGQYFPKDLHLFFQMHNCSQLLATIFQKSCRLASERIEKCDSNSELFFASNLCVREDSMPDLKKALREVILKFVDESVNSAGDRVVRLITALHF